MTQSAPARSRPRPLPAESVFLLRMPQPASPLRTAAKALGARGPARDDSCALLRALAQPGLSPGQGGRVRDGAREAHRGTAPRAHSLRTGPKPRQSSALGAPVHWQPGGPGRVGRAAPLPRLRQSRCVGAGRGRGPAPRHCVRPFGPWVRGCGAWGPGRIWNAIRSTGLSSALSRAAPRRARPPTCPNAAAQAAQAALAECDNWALFAACVTPSRPATPRHTRERGVPS